jgi:uncharacterized protein YjbJ (UPF0337 family)
VLRRRREDLGVLATHYARSRDAASAHFASFTLTCRNPLAGVGLSSAKEIIMDKDRIEGSAEQAKGKIKEVAGKALGDEKLKTEGKADQVKGKVQNAIGGLKDTLRGK